MIRIYHYIMRRFLFLFAVVVTVMMSSCRTQRELVYISDAERDSAQRILASYANTIHTGDLLYIYVSSETMESVIPFNQETHIEAVELSRRNMAGIDGKKVQDTYNHRTRKSVPGYLVDQQGFITLPVLGKILVAGIQHDSLETLIQQRLIVGEYITDPIVTVSPMNFRVSVIGEVRRPRELHITGERLTIFEALAMCGDITMYGQRNKVVVLREKNGTTTPIEIDLTKKTLFDSEAYYLQQNDIVYIEPNEERKRRANYDPHLKHDIVSYVRFGGTLVHMAFITYRRYVIDRRGLFH